MNDFHKTEPPVGPAMDFFLAEGEPGLLLRVRGTARQPRRWRRIAAAGGAALIIAGGGAAVANVGPFGSGPKAVPGGSGDYSNVVCPAGKTGESNCSMFAVTSTPWPRNDFGLTVGEPTQADVIARNLPDLISTITSSGAMGYYRSTELYVYGANGELRNQPASVKVYGPDGRTIVGHR